VKKSDKQNSRQRVVFPEPIYDVTNCPRCGADLTAQDVVWLVAYDERVGLGRLPTRLDADGRLIDVKGAVADGLHSDTECRSCGEGLAEYEVFE
jgi:hypothetical protein